MSYLFILGTIIGVVAGQILIKMGVSQISAPAVNFWFLVKAMTNLYTLTGFLVMLLSGFSWVFAMKFFPLNYAYPLNALTIVLVILVSSRVFGESTGGIYWVSVGLIIMGVALLFFVKR